MGGLRESYQVDSRSRQSHPTAQRAILQYRNSPDPATKQSPATCLFGRPTRDLIPLIPGKYHPHPTWQDNLSQRETALRQRHSLAQERWTEHTRQLSPLKVGDRVCLQNQTGNFPNKWDRTGCVVEVKQFHQYGIRVDGSGRLTLRNRRYLRRFTPAKTQPSQSTILEDITASKPPHHPPPNTVIHLPPIPQSTTTTPAPVIPPPDPRDTSVSRRRPLLFNIVVVKMTTNMFSLPISVIMYFSLSSSVCYFWLRGAIITLWIKVQVVFDQSTTILIAPMTFKSVLDGPIRACFRTNPSTLRAQE